MRLLVVSHVFWPETFRINDLVAAMVARGHEVTVLTGAPNYPDGCIFSEYARHPERFREYAGAQVVRVPIVPRGTGKLMLMLNYASFVASGIMLGAWKLRGRKFDAIFVWESSPVTVGLPAVMLRRLKKAPIAFWVLDLWPQTLEALGILKPGFLLNCVGQLVRFIYARCDLILAQSQSFIPQIARYCADTDRIRYFPSWAELLFSTDAVAPAPEVPVREGGFNVLFAGNIGEAQDFPAILAAAESVRSSTAIRWLIIGDGSMAAWVKEEISRRGLKDSVLMFGRFPLERMPAFYRHADVLLVALKDAPIFAMTIPGKLQSYLAAGIPVIAMLNGEGADVVQDAHAGLVCRAGDHEALAHAVLAMHTMSVDERQQMGRNGHEFAAREFNRDAQITRLEEWLMQLAMRGI